MRVKRALVGMALAGLLLPGMASAASFRMAPAAGSFAAGATFPVAIVVDSPDAAINAVSGRIEFPADKLSVVSIGTAGSVVDLWAREPAFSNAAGTVTFEGVILNPGYQGTGGRVLTVIFRGKVAGSTAPVSFGEGSILANDGNGTNLIAGVARGSYVIRAAAVVAGAVAPSPAGTTAAPGAVPADTAPPRDFVIKEVRQEGDGMRAFARLQLEAEDDGSGIAAFEMQDAGGAWQLLGSESGGIYEVPVLEPGENIVRLRVRDRAGNAAEASVRLYRTPITGATITESDADMSAFAWGSFRTAGTLAGNAQPEWLVRVAFADGTGREHEVTARANGEGRWAAGYPALEPGEWLATARAEDERGVRSFPSDAVSITVYGASGAVLPVLGWILIAFFVAVAAWFGLVAEYRIMGRVQAWLSRFGTRN